MPDSALAAVHAALSQIGQLGITLKTVLALLLGCFLISRLRQWQRLRHFPGPPLAGFSRWFWFFPVVRSGRIHEKLVEANLKYGPIARVAPNLVVTSDWRLWRHALAVRSPYVRADHFMAFRLDMKNDNVASTIDEAEHKRLRTIMIHGYSGKEVEDVEAKIDATVSALVRLLETRYIAHDRPFDFARKALYFTTDAVAHLAFGAPFGFLESDSDVYDLIKINEAHMSLAATLAAFPGLVRLFYLPFVKRLLPTPDDEVGLGRLMGLAKKVAAERFGPNKKVQKDMLGSFVKRGLTQEEVESEILLQVIGGSDTTAVAIRAAVLHVATNPRILRRLQAEIDEVAAELGAGGGDGDDDVVVSDERAREMPYLSAVISESLRIWPPLVNYVPRVVPPAGDEWLGAPLPGGTQLGFNHFGAMHDRAFWGDDADQFRPERWLAAEPADRRRDMAAAVDLVFGGGRWKCLGRAVAFIEIRKLLFQLFRRYEFEVVNPGKPIETAAYNVFMHRHFWLKAHPRGTRGAAGNM